MRDVLIIAGEASGDLHGAGVADRLRALRPAVPLVGMGGDWRAAAGVSLFERAERALHRAKEAGKGTAA